MNNLNAHKTNQYARERLVQAAMAYKDTANPFLEELVEFSKKLPRYGVNDSTLKAKIEATEIMIASTWDEIKLHLAARGVSEAELSGDKTMPPQYDSTARFNDAFDGVEPTDAELKAIGPRIAVRVAK